MVCKVHSVYMNGPIYLFEPAVMVGWDQLDGFGSKVCCVAGVGIHAHRWCMAAPLQAAWKIQLCLCGTIKCCTQE